MKAKAITKPQIVIHRAKEKDMPYIEEKLQKYLLDATNITWQQFFVAKAYGRTVAFQAGSNEGKSIEKAVIPADRLGQMRENLSKRLSFRRKPESSVF